MRQQAVLSARQIREFQKIVYGHYRVHGRKLPWRRTRDPYKILISEVMLQQTQVSRVLEKYEQFIRVFPDIEALARSPLRHILAVWRGLGYNRRALALKRLAEAVVHQHGGRIPSNKEQLATLPGIGNATAQAICAFAFDQPAVFVETNIRAVFIHHFFGSVHVVKDTDIRHLVAQTLDAENPRLWYYALMDYGVALKKQHDNPSRRSAHYHKQSPFKGSNRQMRGAILHALVERSNIAEETLLEQINFSEEAVKRNLKQLEKEGLIVKRGKILSIT